MSNRVFPENKLGSPKHIAWMKVQADKQKLNEEKRMQWRLDHNLPTSFHGPGSNYKDGFK
jgi:DNA/RNA endonuclease G (NUC1)